MKPLLFRADANPSIGTGHIMRCIALAQGWQRTGGRAIFACAACPESLLRRLTSENIETVAIHSNPGTLADAAETAGLAIKINAHWVVGDSYTFSGDWQSGLKNAGLRLLLFDDFGHSNHYFADLVLNQGLQADPSFYASRGPTTELLLGPPYVQLRREFLKWKGHSRNIAGTAQRILVTLGGGNANETLEKVIKSLAPFENIKPLLVMGAKTGANQALDDLISKLRCQVEMLTETPDMPELMAAADVAITAGGATCWETSFMGLPSLTIVRAPNQRGIAEALDRAGITRNLGESNDLAPEMVTHSLEALLSDKQARAEMSKRGRDLVDGNGSDRVIVRMNNITDCHA